MRSLLSALVVLLAAAPQAAAQRGNFSDITGPIVTSGNTAGGTAGGARGPTAGRRAVLVVEDGSVTFASREVACAVDSAMHRVLAELRRPAAAPEPLRLARLEVAELLEGTRDTLSRVAGETGLVLPDGEYAGPADALVEALHGLARLPSGCGERERRMPDARAWAEAFEDYSGYVEGAPAALLDPERHTIWVIHHALGSIVSAATRTAER